MPRYYFDIRENDGIASDEVGLDLPHLQAAEIEAAQSLADMARDVPPNEPRRSVAIEVRSEGRPLFKAALVYELVWH
jgi:hypothetical protein